MSAAANIVVYLVAMAVVFATYQLILVSMTIHNNDKPNVVY